jgi:hypothetical protein
MPSFMNRSCQRQTRVFDLPVRRMISLVPTPSALERMIAARQACFCEALRSLVIASSRPLTDRVIVMESGAHAPASHGNRNRGIPIRTLLSGKDHYAQNIQLLPTSLQCRCRQKYELSDRTREALESKRN